MKRVLLLGASGSIGEQTLDIILENPNEFTLVAFAVGNRDYMIPIILSLHKEVKDVYLKDSKAKRNLKKLYPNINFYSENTGLAKFTKLVDFDMCVNALVGIAGLEPSVVALKKNKILCLANKEALVTGGHIINSLLRKGHGSLYPIDSEHVALAKCLDNVDRKDVSSIIITASGGALRKVPLDKLKYMKAADALRHPTWNMGNKITIDCATMMNKGFEIIEAYFLYHFPISRIRVLMHDESLIHALVLTKNKEYILDYSKPDMHNPIRYAMFLKGQYTEVERVKSYRKMKGCHFHRFNPERYPAIALAKRALKEGGSKLVALNAANEIAVNAFLNDQIGYLDIVSLVEKYVNNEVLIKHPSLKKVLEIDARVKEAIELVGLDFEQYKDRAPFELSGGQKRRVAIAGIIAMKPKVLILDEPTAGLDPSGKEQILSLIKKLKEKCSPTIIVISHDIDEITRFANRLVVFNEGKVAFDEPMKELFKHQQELVEMGLDIPLAIKIANELKAKGIKLGENIVTMSDLLREVVIAYNKKNGTDIDVSKIRKSVFNFDFSNSNQEEVFKDE